MQPDSNILAASDVAVRPFRQTEGAAWDRYVLAHPHGTPFHVLAWSRAVEQAYGHQPLHLAAWAGHELAGILPLFLVKSVFVGRVLVSVPYATYGGILASSEEASRRLLAAAQDLCRQNKARYLELRHREPNNLGLATIDRYDTFRRQLPATADEVLGFLPRKTRAAARKGLDALGPDAVATGPQWLDDIYALYTHTLRRLGSPNYRHDLFRKLQAGYADKCVCMVVRNAGRPVAGVISFTFRDEIVPYFSGSLDEGMDKFANNVMYLSLMEYAVRQGLHWFDFNRSRRDNHGPHAFKRNHGFEPSPLHYQVWAPVNDRPLPNLSPSNRRYALAGQLWRRLPLWMTRPAGELITRWIP